MHAEKCPVCDGEGKIESELRPLCEPKECHGCNGKGWIEVQDESQQMVVYIPQPYQPYIPYEPWHPYYGGTGDQIPSPQHNVYWSDNIAWY